MPLACDGGNFSSPATQPDRETPVLTVEPGLVIQVGFFNLGRLHPNTQARNEETRRSGFLVLSVGIRRDDVWLS